MRKVETVQQDLSRFQWKEIENLKIVDIFGRRANKIKDHGEKYDTLHFSCFGN